jgi:hypothetical protein
MLLEFSIQLLEFSIFIVQSGCRARVVPHGYTGTATLGVDYVRTGRGINAGSPHDANVLAGVRGTARWGAVG